MRNGLINSGKILLDIYKERIIKEDTIKNDKVVSFPDRFVRNLNTILKAIIVSGDRDFRCLAAGRTHLPSVSL